LFRVDVPGQGKSRPPKKVYALDEGELEATLDRLRSEGIKEGSWSISRFKGLGEMNPEQLKDTTMHPDTRRLTQVRVRPGALEETVSTFTMLMGKGEAASRRSWMEVRGNEVEADI
jgi:topoisomerase-4 subunit B